MGSRVLLRGVLVFPRSMGSSFLHQQGEGVCADRCVDTVGAACRSFLMLASIFSVKYKSRFSPEKEDEGRGVGSLRKEGRE